MIPVRGLVNEGVKRFLRFQAETRDRFEAGELTKEAAQLAIEHFWAGALRRAVIDGDVENGSVMAGQSVGMVTRRAADGGDHRRIGRRRAHWPALVVGGATTRAALAVPAMADTSAARAAGRSA